MIEHHRRVISKPGTYLKGQRLSITRAPITRPILWNDELQIGRDIKIDHKQGVIIFLKDVEIESWIGVEFDFDNPEGKGEEVTQKKKWWWKLVFWRKKKV